MSTTGQSATWTAAIALLKDMLGATAVPPGYCRKCERDSQPDGACRHCDRATAP